MQSLPSNNCSPREIKFSLHIVCKSDTFHQAQKGFIFLRHGSVIAHLIQPVMQGAPKEAFAKIPPCLTMLRDAGVWFEHRTVLTVHEASGV